ncbi:MAG: DUF4279 domain-containing protein [Aeromicrobium sp.]|nr:DUF4279 domain-containing protein [Burkholderiales bacterium]
MTNKALVYFALSGNDFEPDEVTRLIGVEPTSIRRKGVPTPVFSFWQFGSEEVVSDIVDIYEMSSALVFRLQAYEAKIANTKKLLKLDAVLQVVLWITADESKSTPAIGFEPEVITFLSNIGASVDIDTYRNVP